MIDRSQLFLGELNQRVLASDDAPKRIGLYDTTLRDGEQSVGVVLDPAAKLRIARGLDELGVDRIEAGFHVVSEADTEAIRQIAAADLRAEVWGFSRAVASDVKALAQLGVRAAVIEAPVSDGKIEAYGLSRTEVLERVLSAIGIAREEGITVCFFGVDGSRADMAFLEDVYASAVGAGAEEVAVVDTIGILAPETVGYLIGEVRTWVGDEVPIHWHGHNDFGLATASAVAAARAGADWIQATINGIGERAGNANIIEIALTLEALYGFSTNLDLSKSRAVSTLVRELAGHEMEPWKAVVGENLFIRESGAVAMQFHDPPAVEPYAAGVVGAQRGIVLGKKSGIVSIRIKGEELGLDLSDEQQRELLGRVKSLGESKGGLVGDDEFRELAKNLTA